MSTAAAPCRPLDGYLATQATERYRACIFYGPAMGGKTRLAWRMRDLLGAYVLDLQNHFLSNPDLCARIDLFRPRDLERLLLGLNVPQSIVVVDNPDFLLNTWSAPMKREFVAMIDQRLQSPAVTEKTFVFLVQTDALIAHAALTNTRGDPRVLPIEAFCAL
jgi:hypothetical protein